MKIRGLFLTLFLVLSYTASAQTDSFQEKIMAYLEVNGTEKQYNTAYEEMFAMLRQHFATADVPESFWTKMKTNKSESIGDVKEMLSFAYRNNFTENDISLMTQFYETETGKQLAQDSSQLTKAQNAEVIAYQESSVGQKLKEKQAELTKNISTISRDWSRELYMEKMSMLVKNGYKPAKPNAKKVSKTTKAPSSGISKGKDKSLDAVMIKKNEN